MMSTPPRSFVKSKVQRGRGISVDHYLIEPENKKEEEQKARDQKKEAKKAFEKMSWSDTPIYADQIVRYPTTTRLYDRQLKLFDLSNPDEEKQLNELFKLELPKEAPKIVITELEKKFDEKNGTFKILVDYYKVQYRKLIDSDHPDTHE